MRAILRYSSLSLHCRNVNDSWQHLMFRNPHPTWLIMSIQTLKRAVLAGDWLRRLKVVYVKSMKAAVKLYNAIQWKLSDPATVYQYCCKSTRGELSPSKKGWGILWPQSAQSWKFHTYPNRCTIHVNLNPLGQKSLQSLLGSEEMMLNEQVWRAEKGLAFQSLLGIYIGFSHMSLS